MIDVDSLVRFGFGPAGPNQPHQQTASWCQGSRLPKSQRDSEAIQTCDRPDVARFSPQRTTVHLRPPMMPGNPTVTFKRRNTRAEKSYGSVAKGALRFGASVLLTISKRGASR